MKFRVGDRIISIERPEDLFVRMIDLDCFDKDKGCTALVSPQTYLELIHTFWFIPHPAHLSFGDYKVFLRIEKEVLR